VVSLIKRTLNFKESEELKGRSENFKKPVAVLGAWANFPWPFLANFFVILSL
jgi:hypothetical protein